MVRSSRAIDDLDIPSIDVAPNKANAPLIVDAGVVPPRNISRRLPGGIRISSRFAAASTANNFALARFWI
jgi:hypothetical protein